MKFRTDFMTNSSSSNYCVSLSVRMKDGNVYDLDPWPEREDGSGDIFNPIQADIDTLASEIQGCKSVKELKDILLGTLDFSEQAEWADEDELDEQGRSHELGEKCDQFAANLDSIESIGDIACVIISEAFNGWGEFARDGIDDFMAHAIPEELDWDDDDAVHEALKDRFEEGEIDAMIEQVRNDSICAFDASITTKVKMDGRTVSKTYSFEDLG